MCIGSDPAPLRLDCGFIWAEDRWPMKDLPLPANPYAAFRDDRERRNALISRDIRLTVIAIAASLGGSPVLLAFVTHVLQ